MSGSASEKYRFADFTWANYRRLLGLMKQHYELVSFPEALTRDRWLVLRHDVDFSLVDALPIARIEAEESVVATYFVLLRSDCYNPLEETSLRALQELVALGHEVGLHFDWSVPALAGIDWKQRLVQERDLLAHLVGKEVRAFSFHNPNAEALAQDEDRYAGLVNAYAKPLRAQAAYCSDSNGIWRFRSLEQVLAEDRPPRLQALTHPEHWTERVSSPHERVHRTIEGIGHRIKHRYEEALRLGGREDVDWETR